MESAIIQGIDSSYEPSGTFTSDYADYCKRKGFRPMYLHQIRANLQQQSQKDASKDPLDKGNVLPLTASITAGSNGLPDKTMTMPDQSDTPNNVNNNTYNNTYNNSNNNAYNNTYNNSNNNTTNPTTNPTSGSGSGNNNSTNNPDSKPSSASVKRMGLSYAAMDYIKTSISGGKGFDPSAGLQFRTPSIQLEYLDEIDSDEILTKISVRGWNLLPGTIEAMYVCLPSAMTLSTLSLWNCGLDDTAFNVLAACLLHCNIVNFQCDQNPVLDSLYAQLFSDLSPIKYVTLRSNSISDTGMEAICAALKFNRTVVTLNLYDNNITDKAMESLSEALKYNQTLNSLSLAKNQIKDEGVKQLTKAFVKVASNAEEIANRRKHFTEMEKRKKDWEEDQTKRAGKPGVKNPSPGRPGSSLKKEQAKTSSNSDLKSPGKKGSVAAAVKQPAAAGKKPGPAAANSTATQAAPPNPPADSNKKGEPRQRSGDVKNKEKEKKAPANVASKVPPASSSSSSKKKEEAQELDEFELFLLEISLEINGVSYLLESGLQYLQDAIQDQESPDGETHDGLYKIPLVGNPGEKSNSSILNTINNILLSRNPFIEDSQANHRDSTSLPGVGNEENAPEQ